MKMNLPKLKTDPDFIELKRQFDKEKKELLEKDILENGCREPICVWNGYIIDGHKRYTICHNNSISFQISTFVFDTKEEAVSWICSEQLSDDTLPENERRYIIGKKYVVEKIVRSTNDEDIDYDPEPSEDETFRVHDSKIAIKLGLDYHLSSSTVVKYAQYARAIDSLRKDFPEYGEQILTGELKISQDNVIELARKPKSKIKVILVLTSKAKRIYTSDLEYDENSKAYKTASAGTKGSSIKDMPVFDPDAYVSSLTLTIPSWINNIKRTAKNSDINIISDKAKVSLWQALEDLITISLVVKKLLED